MMRSGPCLVFEPLVGSAEVFRLLEGDADFLRVGKAMAVLGGPGASSCCLIAWLVAALLSFVARSRVLLRRRNVGEESDGLSERPGRRPRRRAQVRHSAKAHSHTHSHQRTTTREKAARSPSFQEHHCRGPSLHRRWSNTQQAGRLNARCENKGAAVSDSSLGWRGKDRRCYNTIIVLSGSTYESSSS